MDVRTARRPSHFVQNEGQKKNVVCTYWLAGKCRKNPCRFLHIEQSKLAQSRLAPPRKALPRKMTWKNPESTTPKRTEAALKRISPESTTTPKRTEAALKRISPESATTLKRTETAVKRISPESTTPNRTETAVKRISPGGSTEREVLPVSDSVSQAQPRVLTGVKAQSQQCKYWVTGNCVRGDKCELVHGWFCGSGFTMLAKLEGHTKAIAGISLPSGCDKLYSCGKDKNIRAWDCHNGQCMGAIPTEGEIGCLISEGQWLLVGMQNVVKAWNFQNEANFSLDGPAGSVCSMVTDGVDKLFAGIEDGSILVWKWHHLDNTNIPEPAAILKEHTGAVCSLVAGAENKLYSGSRDCTIKIWDCQSFQCLHTLCGHTSDVTSVLCWGSYLISASLDNTLKVWALIEGGTIGVVYERKEDSGVISLCGIVDGDDKPILLCSRHDNSVCLYDLPSFAEKGRIYPRGRVEVIESGDQGLFFTGDTTGEICVWKFTSATAAS